MNIALFYHSLLSDWNHGNAHFLRGVATELQARGHEVIVYEPATSWSYENLLQDASPEMLQGFEKTYPGLKAIRYRDPDLGTILAAVDLVIVHEWTEPALVRAIGEHRARHNYRLLFHDTHHRAVTAPHEIAAYDLTHFDGVLAYGAILREVYLKEGWASHVWVWHEAADTRVFYPRPAPPEPAGDLVWIGNWGDEERTAELREFLIEPVRQLGLRARVHGVRYPEAGRRALADAGLSYQGYLPNFLVPEVFAQFLLTLHVPRRPYARSLPSIPTIRPFEALACGIPLISAPWEDREHLFQPGRDFLVATDGAEMIEQMRYLRADAQARAELAAHGLATIQARHTCGHRVDELLGIVAQL